MASELENLLQRALERTEHLKAVMVSDKDGVIIAKAINPELSDDILEPAFSATFSVASDQTGKLGFGKNTMIMSTFDEDQVVQFNHFPLVLTLLASLDASSGTIRMLIDAGKSLAAPMNIVAESVANALQHEHKTKEYV
ncbi:Ragulator complex protein LAMTOR3 [Phlyctochytrium arcticum]|nr:Ragulator complex protein LAMTOR3 [Phlyctochytrium arcticum]